MAISTEPLVGPPSGYAVTDAPTDRASGRWRRPLAWILAGLLLATIVAPASGTAIDRVHFAPTVGYARPGVVTVNLTVNLTDAPAFVPHSISVPSDSRVSIHLVNVGGYTHTFTLANQSGVVLNRSWTPAQLDQYFATNASQRNVSLAAGGRAYANLTFPSSNLSRSFEFVSVVPYQFQAGMWGFLNVSANSTPLLLSIATTNGLAFQPALLSASPANPQGPANLHILVRNLGGTFPHTFTVAPETNVTITSPGYFAGHPPLANVTVNASATATAWANFTVPGPGIYEFICTVLGHFAAGMLGFLYVGVPPPSPPPPPSGAIVESWVLAGSGIVLGVGLVLALVGGLSGRFPRPPGSRGGHG